MAIGGGISFRRHRGDNRLFEANGKMRACVDAGVRVYRRKPADGRV